MNLLPTLILLLRLCLCQKKKQLTLSLKYWKKKIISIFGVTANRQFTDEEIDSDLIAILLLDINPSYFRIVYEEYDVAKVNKAASNIASKGLELFTNPGIYCLGITCQLTNRRYPYWHKIHYR